MVSSLNNGEWLERIYRLIGDPGGLCSTADLPRSQFYCRLAEQPDHLVPRWYVSRLDKLAIPDELVLSPTTFFTHENSSRPELERSLPLLTNFALSGNVAWVTDPATNALQPFWLEPEVASELQHVTPGDQVHLPITPSLKVLAAAGILVPRNYMHDISCRWNHVISYAADGFRAKQYVPVAGLIHPFHLSALRRYYRHQIRSGLIRLGDEQSSRRYVAHNEAVARFFHHQLTGVVSRIVGEAVKPSYVYLASYQAGAILAKHTDRDQCEFSISLCLDYCPEPERATSWPLHLQTPEGTTTVYQAIGDALLYRGGLLPHYRDQLREGHSSTSIFFHYVGQDFAGPLD